MERNILHQIAGCHETRALLFELLASQERLQLFPLEWRTWDAFAASNMVDWLCYPTELGREPDYLEKMGAYTGQDQNQEIYLYVWRFKNDGDDDWYAGTSGPYELIGEPHPVQGSDTFSTFEKWGNSTAIEHAESILATLDSWHEAWKKESE